MSHKLQLQELFVVVVEYDHHFAQTRVNYTTEQFHEQSNLCGFIKITDALLYNITVCVYHFFSISKSQIA